MKDNKIYTVIFTVLLGCICALVLTYANVQWHPLIIENERFVRMSSILKVLGLFKEGVDKKEIEEIFTNNIKENKVGTMIVYDGYKGEQWIGSAVEMIGRGREGLIKGMLAISTNQSNILAMDVFQQNETPGLGALIGSEKWLTQFKGLPFKVKGSAGIIIDSKVETRNAVDGITGASMTIHAIQKIINLAIMKYLSGGMDLCEILIVSIDEITRSTPGYPKGAKAPPVNLRKEIKRPAFMAQCGVSNLALNKPVLSSGGDDTITGDLEQLTDNIKTCLDEDFVELYTGLQWIQVDLEAVYNISAIVVWHFYKNAVIYNDVIIQISNDKEFKKDVITLFNSDNDNSAGLGQGDGTPYTVRWWGELADCRGDDYKGKSGRYVRVYTAGGWLDEPTRFVEIGVFGK